MIISLPVHTAVWEARGKGASVRLVGVHVSSVQPANGQPTTGSVRFSLLDPAIVVGTFVSALASRDSGANLSCASSLASKRSAVIGLARHSAIIKDRSRVFRRVRAIRQAVWC